MCCHEQLTARAFLLLFEAALFQHLGDVTLPVLAPTHFLRLSGEIFVAGGVEVI